MNEIIEILRVLARERRCYLIVKAIDFNPLTDSRPGHRRSIGKPPSIKRNTCTFGPLKHFVVAGTLGLFHQPQITFNHIQFRRGSLENYSVTNEKSLDEQVGELKLTEEDIQDLLKNNIIQQRPDTSKEYYADRHTNPSDTRWDESIQYYHIKQISDGFYRVYCKLNSAPTHQLVRVYEHLVPDIDAMLICAPNETPDAETTVLNITGMGRLTRFDINLIRTANQRLEWEAFRHGPACYDPNPAGCYLDANTHFWSFSPRRRL